MSNHHVIGSRSSIRDAAIKLGRRFLQGIMHETRPGPNGLVVQENIGSRVASRHDVVERAFEFDSERSGHRNNVPTRHVLYKYKDLNISIIFDPSISVTNSAEVYWGYARYKPDPNASLQPTIEALAYCMQ